MPGAGLVLMRGCKTGGPGVGPNNRLKLLVWSSVQTRGGETQGDVTGSFVCAKTLALNCQTVFGGDKIL